MRIVLFGTNGLMPSEDSHTACAFIPEREILLDAGSGAFRVRKHTTGGQIDVLITHARMDHIVGLGYFLGAARWKPPVTRITVHADQQTLQRIQSYFFALERGNKNMEFVELPRDSLIVNGVQVRHFALEHLVPTRGYRLDQGGKSVAYVSDTYGTVDSAYLADIRGVDLLLHECYLPDSLKDIAKASGHSYLQEVARIAAAARVGRLVLMHKFWMLEDHPYDLRSAELIFPRLQLGEDGAVIEV